MAERIQRKRTAGWRMPEGARYVGRPTKFGNPFRAGEVVYLTGPKTGQTASVADVVDMFRNKLTRTPDAVQIVRVALAGRDLACWCPLVDGDGNPVPCHADVLLEIASGRTS